MPTKIDIEQSISTGWVVYRRTGWAMVETVINAFFRLFTLAVYFFPIFLWSAVLSQSWMSLAILNYRRSLGVARRLAAAVA